MTTENAAYTQTRWSLGPLFPAPDSPELEAGFNRLQESVSAFEQYRSELDEELSPERFLAIIQQYEDIYRAAYQVNAYAGLLFTEDTQDQSAQTLVARVDQLLAELGNRALFFSLWWKNLDRCERRAPDVHLWGLPLLAGGDAPFQAAHLERA
jgi:oligoendopeptidase F